MKPRRALLRNASLVLVLLASGSAVARTPGVIEAENTLQLGVLDGNGLSPLFIPLPFTVQQGDFIYVALGAAPLAADIASINDTQGNNYQEVFSLEDGFGDWRFGTVWTIAQATGPLTLAFQTTAFDVLDVHLVVYSGVKGTGGPIGHSSRNSAFANPTMTCDLDTTEAGEVMVAFMASAGDVQTVGPGAVARSTLNGDLVQDKTASSVGSHTMTAETDSGPWWAQCLTLRPGPIAVQSDSGVGGPVDGGASSDGGTSSSDGGTLLPDGGVAGGDPGALVRSPLASNLGCSATQNVLSLSGIVLVMAALMRTGRRRSP